MRWAYISIRLISSEYSNNRILEFHELFENSSNRILALFELFDYLNNEDFKLSEYSFAIIRLNTNVLG